MYVSVLVRERNRDYKRLEETDARSRDESQSVCVCVTVRQTINTVLICMCVWERELNMSGRGTAHVFVLWCVCICLCVCGNSYIFLGAERCFDLYGLLLTLWKQKDLRFYWNGKWGNSGKWEWLTTLMQESRYWTENSCWGFNIDLTICFLRSI